MIDFNELSELINSDIALIPIDEKKSPFSPFKGKPKLNLVDLCRGLEYYHSERVAARCGEISGGLVCLDIDEKFNEGFAARICLDIKELYPEIWEKLEVDQTPSKGVHFYWKVQPSEVDGSYPRSCDLASRPCYDSELLLRPDIKKKAFIEFKGEGSLCTFYPSVGYKKIKRGIGSGLSGGIQFLSADEHREIISLCGLYDLTVREEPIRKSRARDGIYEEGHTCFDEFNLSSAGASVLGDLGWRSLGVSGRFEKWAKPNERGRNCGASFNQEKRTYAIYSTNAGLEVKCYNPSSLLCREKFGGDWEKLGAYLGGLGFGKIKKSLEKGLVRKAVKRGDVELVGGFSEEAKVEFAEMKLRKASQNPYGEYWTEDEVAGEIVYKISREGVYSISRELGFRNYKDRVVKICDGGIVTKVSDREYFDELKRYSGKLDNQDLMDCYEEFLQKSGKFTISRLDLFDESLLLKSGKDVSYKFYRNCYVSVDSEGIEVLSYEGLNYLIWEEDKKNRDFRLLGNEEIKSGLYWEFINNAIGWSKYLMKCIGFYAHDYRDEESYLVITTEKSEHEKDRGRCGKNIFWKLFKEITTFKSTAASLIKKDNQLLQSWNYERVFCLADIPAGFDLIFFKDIITDGSVVKKLYKDEFSVDVHEMAKIGGSSNYTFDDSDPGVKGRLRLVEFTQYYKDLGGVKQATGKMFPKDWSEQDYLVFDNVMLNCISEYLHGEGVIKEQEISDGGWKRKFDDMYKGLHQFIISNIESWVKVGKVSNKMFNASYLEFRDENNIKNKVSTFTINKALVEYCDHFKICYVLTYQQKNGEMSDGVTWTDNGISVRGRLFGIEAEKFLSKRGIEVDFEPIEKVVFEPF